MIKKYYFQKLLMSLIYLLTLSFTQGAFCLELNDNNIISVIKQRSLTYKETQNKVPTAHYTFLSAFTSYNWTLGLDVSKTQDMFEVAPSNPSLDVNQDKTTLTLNKKYLTGTTVSFDFTRLWYKSDYNQALIYNQDTLALNITQNLYPFFKSNNDDLNYKAYLKEFNRVQLQTKLDENQTIKDILALYWKTKASQVSYKKNAEIVRIYDQLIKTIQTKKRNSYASAGELEQALVEYYVKKQSLQEEADSLNTLIIQLKTALNIRQSDTLTLSLTSSEKYEIPKPFSDQVENTLTYKAQELKTASASFGYEVAENKGIPTVNAYLKLNKQGLDKNSSESFKELTEMNHNKYVIGVTLEYPLNQEVYNQERAYKLSTLQIEQEKQNRSALEIKQNIDSTWNRLQTAYQNIKNTEEIVNLRTAALKQIYMNYTQGRIDISNVLDAYNKKFQSEVSAITALGTFAQTKLEYESLILTE